MGWVTDMEREDVALQRKRRTWRTTCEWVYGKSGSGKSHYAFANYSPDTHYVYINDRGWWDGYTGQPIVIVDDVTKMKYHQLVDLLFANSKMLKRRCRKPVPFLAQKIIITSLLKPEGVYCNLACDIVRCANEDCAFVVHIEKTEE